MITCANHAQLRWLDLFLELCRIANKIQYVWVCLAIFVDLNLAVLLIIAQLGLLNLLVMATRYNIFACVWP
jgi:hypothetical protein